jgi:hypothetical protein
MATKIVEINRIPPLPPGRAKTGEMRLFDADVLIY